MTSPHASPSSPGPQTPRGGTTPPEKDWLRLYGPWLHFMLWVAGAAIVVFALRELAPILNWILRVLSPFLVALIVAYVLHPIVTFVQRKLHLGRIGGIAVLALAFLLSLVIVVLWLAPVLYHEVWGLIQTLRDTLPAKLEALKARAPQSDFIGLLGARAQEILQKAESAIKAWIANPDTSLEPVAAGSIGAVRSVAEGVVRGMAAVVGFFGALATLGFIIVIAVYYLLEMDAIPRVIRRALPLTHRERIWGILLRMDESVGGILRGQLLACLGVGTLTVLLLLLVGLKEYAVLIGVCAGLLNFIPYLGPVSGATPALLWVLFSDEFKNWSERGIHLGFIVLGFAIIQAVDGFVFQPYIVGKRAQLHPLAVMLALAIGIQAGLGGMVLAVPVACACKVLWIELYWSHQPEDAKKPQKKSHKSQVSGGNDEK